MKSKAENEKIKVNKAKAKAEKEKEKKVKAEQKAKEKKEAKAKTAAAKAAKKQSAAEKKSAQKAAKQSAKTTKAQKPDKNVKTAPAAKNAAAEESEAKEYGGKVYHVSLRSEDDKWQVKLSKGDKAIKLFDTQAEAIAYANELAVHNGRVVIHRMNGKIRKKKY